jgi:transposase InsO family protein
MMRVGIQLRHLDKVKGNFSVFDNKVYLATAIVKKSQPIPQGKQFTSKIFKHFLEHNNIKDKFIPNSYPQLQGKVEAYNKIIKNEFISVEQISSIDEDKVRYDMFVKAYNDKREHG